MALADRFCQESAAQFISGSALVGIGNAIVNVLLS